jgi:hypothetical protein
MHGPLNVKLKLYPNSCSNLYYWNYSWSVDTELPVQMCIICSWMFPLPLWSLWQSKHPANLGSISRPCVQWVSVGFGWNLSIIWQVVSFRSLCGCLCPEWNTFRTVKHPESAGMFWIHFRFFFTILLDFNPFTSETKLLMVYSMMLPVPQRVIWLKNSALERMQ